MKLARSVIATAVMLVVSPAIATAAPAEINFRAGISKAVVRASAQKVTEGDRITLRVRVPQVDRAKRVVLQERTVDIFGNDVWSDVSNKRAKGRLKFRHTVTAHNTAAYRVATTYRGRTNAVVSKPVKVTVWRWIDLHEFARYYETSLSGYGEADMNGSRYAVWGGYAGTTIRAWEARVTPGRHCTQFRTVLGLADTSDDGSSGVVSFSADDALIYQSPALTPGMTLPVTLELNRPYRFGMAAANTSADKVKAYPMVGNGAFYCTGIEG